MLPLLAAIIMQTPRPTADQLAWQKMQMCAFVHFGPNTFTGEEWGTGSERPEIFNPKQLDCRQWVHVFKAAGFKGVIVTAKHHDGFCLWPSRYSNHTVRESAWRGGKGDVLGELSKACHEEGLKFGVYLSPWDRNHPNYGTPAYNKTFTNMLHEVLTQYGPVFEVWFDGANGEGPNGKKQVYDWPAFIAQVRKDAPHAVIFSDAGPDVRWVGNEDGYAGETNWNTIDRNRYAPGTPLYAELTQGTESAPDWVPAECDVSIRPGWFWKKQENSAIKSVDKLLDIWYGSVGRGANLLLNVPPNSDGRIDESDRLRLEQFSKALHTEFAHPIKARLSVDKENNFQYSFAAPSQVDRVWLAEKVANGQKIRSWRILAKLQAGWREIAKGTTIGAQRVLRITPVETETITVIIDPPDAAPNLADTRFYNSVKLN